MIDDRQVRGMAIIAKGDMPTELGQNQWRIPSQNGGGVYNVAKSKSQWGYDEWSCSCPDHQYRKIECKHIHAIRFWMQVRNAQKPEVIKEVIMPEPIADGLECVYCGSNSIRKFGSRKTTHGTKQRIQCTACKQTFTVDAEFGKLSTNPEVISVVLDLYFKGISTRKISDHLKQFYKMNVNHSTIYRWVVKYTKQIHQFTEKIKPATGRIWHGDEMMVNIEGKKKWQWNVLDKDSRFLLASHITEKRFVKDANNTLKTARKQAGNKPEYLFTDGLYSYRKASHKQLATTNHIRCTGIRSQRENNNKIERLHNTIRERDKAIRSYKTNKTAQTLVNGFQDYYNYIREHQAIGTTPAQKAGVSLKLGENRWLGILKQSCQRIA